MKKEIIINATSEETRIAILEDGTLVELFVELPENQRQVGDIYKGKVSRVLPGMQAVFVNIGHEQNAFMHFSDYDHASSHVMLDMDEDGEENGDSPKDGKKSSRSQPREMDAAKHLKAGQDIVVQIMKEPIGTKGSRITSQISIPGRFAVLIPNQRYIGISRKISNFKEKKRLRQIVRSSLPDNFGLIVRTVAEGRSEKDIRNDIDSLVKIWRSIEKKIQQTKAPNIVYKDMGMASSVIRDLFTPDVSRVVVDSRILMREISQYIKDVAPNLKHKVEYYRGKLPVFDFYKIEPEIDKSMQSKVWLKNGAYIVIQQTEALVSIDVNSGKFIGRKDHETNSLKIDLEAAREIARQARLRDVGGLIVIDFIDVLQDENKRKIYRELRREFAKDRSITKIEPMSRFGLVEMTRQRVRPSVLHTIHEECPVCSGIGWVPTVSTVSSLIERWLQRYRAGRGDRRITIRVPGDVYDYMMDGRYSRRLQLMWKYWMKLNIVRDDSLGFREFKVYDRRNKNEIRLK